MVFQETHESIRGAAEAIPGFQASRNTTPLVLRRNFAEQLQRIVMNTDSFFNAISMQNNFI